MFKYIFSVCCIFLTALIQGDCLYPGDECEAGGRFGICMDLEKCDHVLKMVINAGQPMPLHMRETLHKLGCGFNGQQPMICCTSDDTGPHIPHTTHSWYTSKDPTIWGIIDNKNNGDTFNKPPEGWNSVESPDGDNSGDVNSRIGDGLQDVQNHPNLKLLPEVCGFMDSDRVLGGTKTEVLEMPWMVLLSYYTGRETKLFCGGTLITEYYVLTAAHCVTFLNKGWRLNGVILGEHDLNQDPDCASFNASLCAPKVINATIDRVISFPGYTLKKAVDDIALIRLSKPVDLYSVSTRPICLPITPELQNESLIGKNLTIAGWGLTDDRISSSVLLNAVVPVLNNDRCRRAYNKVVQITNKQICAGGLEGVDSCSGDSGGPLTFPGVIGDSGAQNVQRGVISFGSIACGVKDSPTVYTNVAYYMKWILDNISN